MSVEGSWIIFLPIKKCNARESRTDARGDKGIAPSLCIIYIK